MSEAQPPHKHHPNHPKCALALLELVLSPTNADGKPALGGRGGPIDPAVSLDGYRQQLSFAFANIPGEKVPDKVEVSVQGFEGSRTLLNTRLEYDPKSNKPAVVDLLDSGMLDYLRIQANGREIRLSSIELKRKPMIKSQR